jgi:hypothetical protein
LQSSLSTSTMMICGRGRGVGRGDGVGRAWYKFKKCSFRL